MASPDYHALGLKDTIVTLEGAILTIVLNRAKQWVFFRGPISLLTSDCTVETPLRRTLSTKLPKSLTWPTETTAFA